MINYRMEGEVAVLQMDDGKANVLGHTMIDALHENLDKAESEAKATVLVGREGMFSGGFDLSEFAKGAEASLGLVKRGFPLLLRLFQHPQPLVAACSGHAIAAGSFMLLACDSRIGAAGGYKHRLPETAIGMTMPGVLHELAAARISPRFLTAAVIQAKVFDPELAVQVGFLDKLADAGDVEKRAIEEAIELAQMPTTTYAQNKVDCRKYSIERMQASIEDVLATKM
ncbi:MAG: crotonase/enoyl-CoA hydratase family protein [Pseudomonadales bacterium]